MKLKSILFLLFSFICFSGIAQGTGEITERIVSEKGTVLDNVNISILGTNKGTYSNEN